MYEEIRHLDCRGEHEVLTYDFFELELAEDFPIAVCLQKEGLGIFICGRFRAKKVILFDDITFLNENV